MADNREHAALDEAFMERLYVKLEKRVFNVVYRWVWSAAEAEDITQDAFMRVWGARDRVDVLTVEPLVYRTAINLASNRRRARRLWGWLGLESVDETPSATPPADDELASARSRQKVRAAIDALPDALRRVVLLSEYSELSHAEIGAILGIPSGTVGSRRNTALRKLEETLGALEDSPT
jgi:RNA polymerase sigma-70 factor (ECF subfamily)